MNRIFHFERMSVLAAAWAIACASLHAQQSPQPPPFTVPPLNQPAAPNAPGQQALPRQQSPQISPDAPLPQPQQSTIPLRELPPLSAQPPAPNVSSAAMLQTEDSKQKPTRLLGMDKPRLFLRFDAYTARRFPDLTLVPGSRIDTLIRDGKLYLSLRDALALAIENNLAVEVSRYNILAADTDEKRAAGGGMLRRIDTTVIAPPPGVNAASSPLIAEQANTNNPLSTNAALTDLSDVTQTGGSTSSNLTVNGGATYSNGPAIPLYDPSLFAQAGYLRRSNTTQLISTAGSTTTTSGPLDFVNAALDYQQGFSTGTQIEAYADNAAQVLYANASQRDPFHSPSTSITVTQPLLRGFGRGVNLRFLRIARLEEKQSRAVFEQQLLETVYGISRLYYDLVALGENVGVKELSLAAAQKLYDDDKDQMDQGTLAPIELARAQALLSSSKLDLVQARGEYRQEEAILRQQLLRRLGVPAGNFLSIVPTDRILVPDEPPALNVPELITEALQNRPDLASAALELNEDATEAKASRSAVKPLFNAYANVQTRGSALTPYVPLGGGSSAPVEPNSNISQGGLRLSTIVQGGIQLNLPIRNRVAQADAERDAINLRQAQARNLLLENEVRQQVENAVIALENAHQSYVAAVESRNYQQQLLQAEQDKFAIGQSTNYLVLQDESYLAQARATEVAARANWMKARITLDRALGNLLSKNGISVDDAIDGHVQ